MCFSATASFLAAGVTGTIGLACVALTASRREWPLAATPVLFAIQQAVEGYLWLSLPDGPDGPLVSHSTVVFLLWAKVLWPTYAPMAVLLIETDKKRRTLAYAFLIAGLTVSAHFLNSIVMGNHEATILGGHIVYNSDNELQLSIRVLYFLAVCGPLLISSHAPVRLFGGIVTLGAATAYAAYWGPFTSVWCFFAAGASVVLLLSFAHVARLRSVDLGSRRA